MSPVNSAILIGAASFAILSGRPAYSEVLLDVNIGFVSDYIFRGVEQSNSSASAGLDVGLHGLYAGTFVIDVDPGLEYDLYGGYALDLAGFGLDLNYTSYNFTQDDPNSNVGFAGDTSREVNLGVSYGLLDLRYTKGTFDNFQGHEPGNRKLDYTVGTARLSYLGFSVLYGANGDEFDGSWWEIGYGADFGGFDASVKLVISNASLDDEEYIIFSLNKSFDLIAEYQHLHDVVDTAADSEPLANPPPVP